VKTPCLATWLPRFAAGDDCGSVRHHARQMLQTRHANCRSAWSGTSPKRTRAGKLGTGNAHRRAACERLRVGQLRATRPCAFMNTSVCLHGGEDLLTAEVRAGGFWRECADLPAMLERTPSSTPEVPPLFVDIGANVGACSVHMLLTTAAYVVAFEPGGDNLFYVTSSLQALRAAQMPGAAGRMSLIPSALGSASAHQLLHQAIGNAGHAVIGQRPTGYAPKGHVAPQPIQVQRLDDVLWPLESREITLPPSIALMKIDVEGFECEVLRGMRSLLGARAVQAIKIEVFETLLRLQGCSALELRKLLAEAGFEAYVASSDSSSLPADNRLAPDAYTTATGLPYNLYCMLTEPKLSSASATPPLSLPLLFSPPSLHLDGSAAGAGERSAWAERGGGGSSNERGGAEWRGRRSRSFARKYRRLAMHEAGGDGRQPRRIT